MLNHLLLLILSLGALTTANVEKVIFTGPEAVPIPSEKPTLTDLHLRSLTPRNFSVRTELGRVFPSEPSTRGTETWLLLDNLQHGQRYEVRVCWSALEPTSFDLDVFELNTVWSTPELIQSLAAYAFSQQSDQPDEHENGDSGGEQQMIPPDTDYDGSDERLASVLLLRVIAAADYFTDNADLMANPPPVLVDLILDPFLLNVLPRSLLPTVGYIAVVVVVTWLVARRVASSFRSLATSPQEKAKKNQ